ncbi:MAG: UbiA family prenyltransferase [Planctomycetota bacterium]
MDALIGRLSPVLHLTRITHAVAAVGNVWLVVLWSRAMEADRLPADARLVASPLWHVLGISAVLGIALFSFAMVAHDAFDEHRDRTLRPDRPLASGAVSRAGAVAIATVTLIGAVASGAWLGGDSLWLVCAVSVGIVLYQTLLRPVPSVGLVFVGLIYAAHMVSPNPTLGFLWPVAWAMTHAVVVEMLAHRIGDKRPRVDRRALAVAAVGCAAWTAVMVGVGYVRLGVWWPGGVSLWVVPTQLALLVGFVAVARRKTTVTRSRARASEKARRYGALWQPLYALAWCAGASLWDEAVVLAVLAAAGFLALTFLREVYSLIEQPVGYRR